MWVEEAALRFWLAELWLGSPSSGSYSWKPETWRHDCHTSLTSSTCLADTASLEGLSEWLVPSRTSYQSTQTHLDLKTPQESQNRESFPNCAQLNGPAAQTQLCCSQAPWSRTGSPFASKDLPGIFYRVICVDSDCNWSSNVISEDAKAGKAGEESLDLWLAGLPGVLSHTCCSG